MSDNGYLINRPPQPDPHLVSVVRDGGYEVARMLRLWAVLGIAARLFLTYASAKRIAVVHDVLNRVPSDTPVRNGKFDLSGQAGAADLISKAQDSDSLVKLAWIATIIAMVFFLATSVALHRRRKRDSLAASFNQNRAIRFAGRLYVVPTVASGLARSLLNSDPVNSPIDQLHRTTDIDVANMTIQMFVIAFMLIVALAMGRELRKATAVPSVGILTT